MLSFNNYDVITQERFMKKKFLDFFFNLLIIKIKEL